MVGERFSHKVFLMIIICAVLFSLAGCKEGKQMEGSASTVGVEIDSSRQPTDTSVPSEARTEDLPTETDTISAAEFVSATELFSVEIPSGWSTEEVVPGADLITANTETALARYKQGSAIEPGDFILNVGFLPFALLQDKNLSHLGFQLEASPEVALQSILPLFRIGEEPAVSTAGEPTLVSLSDGHKAGMMSLSGEGREGMVLLFEAGEGILAFVSAVGFPGEMAEFQELTYALASEVVYHGTQEALYAALRGG